jgi:hypothetical protein
VKRPLGLFLTLTGLVWGGAALGASIRGLEIVKEGERYELVADTYLEAPADGIFAVLTDYDSFYRISSIYKESGFLAPGPDGTTRVFTVMEGCLLFFCKSMRRVERLEAEPHRYIRTTALPEESDFAFSRSDWILEPEKNGTKVTFLWTMEPAFWVPPVIGPWLLKRNLLQGGTRAVNRIERMARERTGLPPLQASH